ncbi:MAG: glucans biosynthesis glucosyltransferase MdoH [Pseudomonadota bacterium]
MALVEIRRRDRLLAFRPPAPHAVFAALTAVMMLSIVLTFAASIPVWGTGALIALPLVAITALWISGGAATAILGLSAPTGRRNTPPKGWYPTQPTAILITLCGENPGPMATHLAALRRQLDRADLAGTTQIFILSDTSCADRITAEEAAFQPLIADGTLTYRRRPVNTGRKPGNIADWLAAHGDAYTYMMVLDADSRMTARRIRQMIWHIARHPRLGLLQAGIALVPGQTRFGRHQRVAARLMSRNFGRGFAAWTGACGNYWGHNAIMRTAAFRAASHLPRLPGTAPFGGDLLSHDFIEAAWIRRAGWDVMLDPETGGSAENAPQTLAAFHHRDRRWCQGNLQHIRLLATPGLSPTSRIHLAAGILSYLVAPAWLVIVGLIASGAVTVGGLLPLLLVAVVLALPKLCALADWLGRARTVRRRRVAIRAWAGELGLSSLIAPLIMLRQVGAIASVCLGRDCGWKTGRTDRFPLPAGAPEAAIGLALVSLAWLTNGAGAFWLAPVALPLCAAPILIRALNAQA